MNTKVKHKLKKSTAAARRKRTCPSTGVANISSTFNNTIITISDLNGQVIAASSGGVTQKGARKSTSFAAQEAAKLVGKKVSDMGMLEVKVILKGPGSGRDSAVRGLVAANLKILTIADRTPLPHGGVRRRKQKRV